MSEAVHEPARSDSAMFSLRWDASTSSWTIGCTICFFTVVLFLLISPANWHWYVLPVALSGCLIAQDAVEWLRGRLATVDPVGLFGLFGLHFYFLSYLLHPTLGFYWHYRFPPADWRPWLAYSASLNVLGLLIYRWLLSRSRPAPARSMWVIDRSRLVVFAAIAMLVSTLLQLSFYSRFGGFLGAAYARERPVTGSDPFEGLGWAISLAESFPVLLVIVLLVFTRRWRVWSSVIALPALLAVALGAALYFGGVRGSRSNVFLVLFWTAVLFHTLVRPINRKLVLAGPFLLFIFMTGYMFYKHGGVEGAENLGNTDVIEEIESRIGFGNAYAFIVLHDFARADSQALLLYLDSTDDQYEYAMGRTILAGVLSVIPRAIWPERPENANREKTTLLYGIGSDRHVYWNFGLSGEALLNFGPIAMPLAFVLCAGVVLYARKTMCWARDGDARALLWPLVLYMCFVTPIGETQVLVWSLAKNGIVPVAVVVLSASRRTLGDA